MLNEIFQGNEIRKNRDFENRNKMERGENIEVKGRDSINVVVEECAQQRPQ